MPCCGLSAPSNAARPSFTVPPPCKPPISRANSRVGTVPQTGGRWLRAARDAHDGCLLFGNLVIGTGVLLPAGLMSVILAGIDVSAAEAGLLLTIGGLVVGFGAPIVAGVTSRIDRRVLLVGALALYVIGHCGAALSNDLTLILGFRALTVAGAAIFTRQAAATAALIMPPDRRSGAIAFIFIGWSLASVIGIPLGSLLGDAIGWQATVLLMAGLSALAAVAVWLVLPGGLRVQPLGLRPGLGC
jgi:MFS transporter, DHA1 family, inner membrane transport protein